MVLNAEIQSPSLENYIRSRSLGEAVAALAGGPKIFSGGTDFYPAHVGKSLPTRLLDVSAVPEMRGITSTENELRIGGSTTWTEIATANLPLAFQALQEAARQVGSIQVQNRGTIAGNICNASPAADGIPPLLILNAEVELTSATGVRRMPVSAFVTGYRKTALSAGEILSAVFVPVPPADARSAFLKLGARKYLVISIVMAASLIRKDATGAIVDARIAVGSASATAQRLDHLERELLALPKDQLPSSLLRAEHFASLSPIDDVRATASYRRDAAWQVVADVLDQAAGR